jgi:uncharacterized protein (DUF302 family)
MNRKIPRGLIIAVLAFFMICITTIPAWAGSPRIGITAVKSKFDVATTAERLEAQIQSRNFTLVAKIDHAAAAKKVDLDLRPTQVFIFGNPKGGTPLMQCNQTAGIDLPLKALIWQDEAGSVWFGYNTARYIGMRHRLSRCGQAIGQMLNQTDRTLRDIAATVTDNQA